MSKLTLHVPEALVRTAKREAAARKVSVSKLVSDYFALFEAGRTNHSTERLAPHTQRLSGCLSPEDAEIERYIDHLEQKHS